MNKSKDASASNDVYLNYLCNKMNDTLTDFKDSKAFTNLLLLLHFPFSRLLILILLFYLKCVEQGIQRQPLQQNK